MPPSPYYTYLTQQIANGFASWMDIRNKQTSVGQQFLNVFGVSVQDITRAFNAGLRGLFLANADINVADVLQEVILPRAVPLSQTNPPICIGNGNAITELTDVDTFLYLSPPTRITHIATAIESSLTYTDIMPYDIPWVDAYGNTATLNYQYNTSTNQLMKWRPVGELLEVPGHIPQGTEVLGSYNLKDIYGNIITGTYNGACLYLDKMLIAFGQTLYVFDVRIPLNSPMVSGWVGNQEQNFIQATTQFNIPVTINGPSGNSGLSYDPRATYFWIKSGTTYYQFSLNYDYVLFDFQRQIALFREEYSTLTIGGIPYAQQIHNVWNYFDEFGLLLNVPRLQGETNQAYQARLLTTFTFRSNSTVQGVVDGISRDLDLEYYGYFPSGVKAYPKNLFPTQEFPANYPIYPSGIFPSGITDIAKINALYDPVFYSSCVNGLTNIPTAEFVDYSKEILSTFPIVWGSGVNDPIGFIWDLAPFDGGLNNVPIIPDYFANMASGISSAWYQSGVVDPTTQDLSVRLIANLDTQQWIPQVWNGGFYINNSYYYLYSQQGSEAIPSGANPYNVIGSGILLDNYPITIIDTTGTTAPSGTNYLEVSVFDSGSPYEFIYTSGQISFNSPQNGLSLYYETSASGWYTIPGWDFNPTHAAIDNGFVWISNQEQVVNPSGYTLQVIPNSLPIGGGAAVLKGNLIDSTGEPITGAEAFFQFKPTTIGSITNSSTLTGLDGNAYSLYNSPTTINGFGLNSISASGNTIVVSGLINTNNYWDVWTIQNQIDISGYIDAYGYNGLMPVLLMEPAPALTSLSIPPSGWRPLSTTDSNYGNFQGVYTIGGAIESDGTDENGSATPPASLFNIQLSSLEVGSSAIGPVVSGNPAPFQYQVDSYNNPQDYGKVELYTVTIPVGSTSVEFQTFTPSQPIAIQPNVPASGLTTLKYDSLAVIPSGSYTVYSPASVTIESWAQWQGVQTLHQFQTISLNFPNQGVGVFRLDDSFIDFISYLRYT